MATSAGPFKNASAADSTVLSSPSAPSSSSSSAPFPISNNDTHNNNSNSNSNSNSGDSGDSEQEKEKEEPWLATYPARQLVAVTGGLLAGTALGLGHGVLTAGLRFRAENAHRLPTATKGWYLYHKSKNYYAMWGGLREAARMAPKLGFWVGAFVAVEESVHRLRRDAGLRRQRRRQHHYQQQQQQLLHQPSDRSSSFFSPTATTSLPSSALSAKDADALDTVVAGLAIAGGWSAWNRFPLATAARTARMGLTFGLAYGLTQDAWRLLRGRKVSYVEFARRRLGGRGVEQQQQQQQQTRVVEAVKG